MNNWLNICFDAMLKYIPENFTTVDETEKFRMVATHIDVIGSYLYTDTTTDDTVAMFYSMAGIGHAEISNYETALDYYFKSATIRQKNGNEQALGLIYNNIAVVYNIKAMYKSALEYNHKSIEISEKNNAPEKEIIIAYNNLAIVYSQCTAYEDALIWNTKALKKIQDNALTDDPISADALIMRATIHYVNEEFEEALKLDFKALDILKKYYLEEHADICRAYNSIAREYFSIMRYDDALEYYHRVQKIYESIYGEDDSDTAEVYGSLSKTYMALQKYNDALELGLKALQTQEKTLGLEYPEVILRNSFIADIYEHLELFEEAISHLLIILNYYIKVDNKEVVGIVSERIAVDFERINNISEAVKYRQMTGGNNE
jgi:tetratricopeptide (TPR) repeat protein